MYLYVIFFWGGGRGRRKYLNNFRVREYAPFPKIRKLLRSINETFLKIFPTITSDFVNVLRKCVILFPFPFRRLRMPGWRETTLWAPPTHMSSPGMASRLVWPTTPPPTAPGCCWPGGSSRSSTSTRCTRAPQRLTVTTSAWRTRTTDPAPSGKRVGLNYGTIKYILNPIFIQSWLNISVYYQLWRLLHEVKSFYA